MGKIFLFCLMAAGLFGQSNADIKQKIKDSGLSESQVRQIAKQRGMSDAEVDAKAKELKGESTEGEAVAPSIEDIPESTLDDVSMELGPEAGEVEDAEIEQETQLQPAKAPLAYFGYDIFKQDPELFQASVFGSVDPDYNIGPGDEIIIMLWGETQFRQVLTVDREGFIFIPEVGQVFVNGLTMDLLESKLFKVLSQRYSSLVRSNSGNPTTFLDVSLGNLRPLRILVVGEVAQPGAYRVSPSTTLFSALYYFNGPTTLGSLRNVQLIRGGKEISSIDFYDYLLSGKKLDDVRLQLDDTIFLPPRGKTVSIEGEINRPAIYELNDDEGLLDIVALAGDLKASAYLDRVQIDRIVPVDEREITGMDRMYVDVNIKDLMDTNSDFELLDGDSIQVFPVMDLRKNYVEIRGNVERPGTYELKNGEQISDLVALADGVINDAYMEKAHLVRINEDLTQDMFEINLGMALSGDENTNMDLQPFDILYIYNKNSIFNAFKTVEVNGSVKRPGRYPYFAGMEVNDLLVQAGGLANDVYQAKLELMRVDPKANDPNSFGELISIPHNFTHKDLEEESNNDAIGSLQPHDVLFVRADPNFNLNKRVTITGEVMYPGEYALLYHDELISDIIKRAGGLTIEAYPEASNLNRGGNIINIDLEKILDRPGSNIDYKVLSGDVIHILAHPSTVVVAGEVNNPGTFKFVQGKNVKDYIELAGGFTSRSNKRDVWVQFPGGEGKEVKAPFLGIYITPKVKDGSVITVAREEQEDIDKTELAKEITSIVASLAQVIVMVILAGGGTG